MSDSHPQRTKAAYDRLATAYAQALPDMRAEASLDLAMILHFVDQLSGNEVLDAGCGTGRVMTHLSLLEPSLRLAGVDLSLAMVDTAKKTHPDAHIVEADLAELPFEDEGFDGVIAWYSIIHSPLEDLISIFTEFRRVLRPGGLLLLGFQSGTGVRDIANAYGQEVELRVYLNSLVNVKTDLEAAELDVCTLLERDPTDRERHPQAFVLARRSGSTRVTDRRTHSF